MLEDRRENLTDSLQINFRVIVEVAVDRLSRALATFCVMFCSVPPAVATDLTPGRWADDPRMMSLPDYINETMQIIQQKPTPSQVCVEKVKFLRFAEATGNFEKALQQLNTVRL